MTDKEIKRLYDLAIKRGMNLSFGKYILKQRLIELMDLMMRIGTDEEYEALMQAYESIE